tara:strand:- start:2603 stop:2803 length:201 start_codon:yes stop_codon:yes gene_type:complete
MVGEVELRLAFLPGVREIRGRPMIGIHNDRSGRKFCELMEGPDLSGEFRGLDEGHAYAVRILQPVR